MSTIRYHRYEKKDGLYPAVDAKRAGDDFNAA